MLKSMAEAGNLPPVDERLPTKPAGHGGGRAPGEYGGTLRRAILGGGDQHNLIRTIGSENLVTLGPDMDQESSPTSLKAGRYLEDATTFTFQLRRRA